MFMGTSRKQRLVYEDWIRAERDQRNQLHADTRFPLAVPVDPDGPDLPKDNGRYFGCIKCDIICFRIIIAWGNGSKNNRGNRASPSSAIYRYLKRMSKQLGRFSQDHANANLVGQQRLIVLKVNEDYTSRTPSCWALGEAAHLHPPLPDAVPGHADQMQHVDGKWSVLRCPHCQKIWERNINAIRYFNTTLLY